MSVPLPPTPAKFCKSLLASGSITLSPSLAARFLDKALYEFWGFCVNGGTSLTHPGGIAATHYPTGFESGSNVLLAAGNDGSTSFGTDIFESLSTNFSTLASGSLIGKYLVTWIPGDASTDDSIYFIKSVEDVNHIRVDIHTGGTRRLGNHPCFWDRQTISFRIVDIVAACQVPGWTTYMSSAYMVLQLPTAPRVNSGQSEPQVKFLHHTSSVTGGEGDFGLVFSPSGSWNGSTFSDGTPEVTSSWFNSTGNVGQSTYTFIGSGDFLIAEARAFVPGPQDTFTAGSGFHIEVPQRMYSQQADPNPLAWVMWQNAVPSQVAASYYNGFQMVGRDNNVHNWTTLVRSLGGTSVRADYTGNAYGTGQWQQFGLPAFRFNQISYDSYNDQYITTDGVLSLSTPGQFSLARARLRRVRFTTNDIQRGGRIGDPITEAGAWVAVANGILWPWDDSLLPEGPWRFGV